MGVANKGNIKHYSYYATNNAIFGKKEIDKNIKLKAYIKHSDLYKRKMTQK